MRQLGAYTTKLLSPALTHGAAETKLKAPARPAD